MQKNQLTFINRCKRDYKWYVFLLPITAGLLLFMLYPIFESLRLSFYDSNGFIEEFVGFENYISIISDDLFWKSVGNTLYITFFNVILLIPIAFILASLINNMKYLKNTSKALFFVSYITPGVAASTVFLYVFHPQGIANMLLGFIGIDGISWFAQPTTAQWAVIIYAIWKGIGFNMIIFLAALQTIPKELYEASSIDGANSFKSWLYITIPNMKQSISFLVIMGFISGLKRFQDVYIFGKGSVGSPERSLYTIVSYIYDKGFGGDFKYGVASAAAYVLFIIIIIITLVNKKITKLDI